MNDPTSPFFSEIARLRQELERANESIDEKLERIEEAGMDVISLTRKVEDGRARIAALEDDIDRLSRKDDRRTRRLQKMRCGKCRTKIDARSIDADERYMRRNYSTNLDLTSNNTAYPIFRPLPSPQTLQLHQAVPPKL